VRYLVPLVLHSSQKRATGCALPPVAHRRRARRYREDFNLGLRLRNRSAPSQALDSRVPAVRPRGCRPDTPTAEDTSKSTRFVAHPGCDHRVGRREAHRPSLAGAGEIPLRRLVKEALRMRPSRLMG